MVSRNTPAQPETPSAEVAVRSELPVEVVRSFHTVADVEAFFQDQGIELGAGEEISDGFETTQDKDKLINTTFVIIDWNKVASADFGQDFLTIRLMTLMGEKYRISDGSTGIAQQLADITAVRLKGNHPAPNAGVIVKGGLSKSEYWVSVADGKAMSEAEAEATPKDLKKKASTFYLVF